MEIQILNLEGKKVGTEKGFADFEKKTFSPKLIHQVAVGYLTNMRISRAHTKDRAERRGGGIKPWRQKGTGRARAGSSRSPIWRKGGVTFGPRTEKNYVVHTPNSMKKTALVGVLAGKVKDGEFFLLDEMPKVTGKSKELAAAFSKLKLNGKTLFLVAGTSEERSPFLRASKNNPQVEVKSPESVNAIEILNATFIVTNAAGLKVLENRVKKSK